MNTAARPVNQGRQAHYDDRLLAQAQVQAHTKAQAQVRAQSREAGSLELEVRGARGAAAMEEERAEVGWAAAMEGAAWGWAVGAAAAGCKGRAQGHKGG